MFMDIKTIPNGFEFNNKNFEFSNYLEIISSNQLHIGTTDGVILLDLSCTINDVEFTDINLFAQALTNEA